MKKATPVKKLMVSALVILYDIVSLFWCYVSLISVVYDSSFISVGNSMEIIGGADTPTLMFVTGNVLRCVLAVLFILLSVGSAVLSTVSLCKKPTNRKIRILLCLLPALALMIFVLIPAQSYVVALYLVVRKIPFLKYAPIGYVIVSAVMIVVNVLSSHKSY